MSTLRGIAENPKEQAQARVNAAKALLEYGLRFAERNSGAAALRVVIVDDVPKTLAAPQSGGEEDDT